jgi:hypothetical protein
VDGGEAIASTDLYLIPVLALMRRCFAQACCTIASISTP